MSAQPNVDAGEIQHNRMKLAMAVGDSRHYVMDEIMPRHFLQDGGERRRARFPRSFHPGPDRKRYGSRNRRCSERSAA
jgi:hypothetical protein